MASDLAQLLKKGGEKIKIVISTHHSLFFNVMCNELGNANKYFFHMDANRTSYILHPTTKTAFLYHIAMLSELQKAAEVDKLYIYHFNILRSIMEKTAIFFGLEKFSDCIDGVDAVGNKALSARALNVLSHGNYSMYEPKEMGDDNKKLFKTILKAFLERYRFKLPEMITESTNKEPPP